MFYAFCAFENSDLFKVSHASSGGYREFFFALFSSTPNSQSNPLFVDKIEKGHHDYTMKDEGLLDYNALGIRCTEIFSWISGDYLLIFNFVFSILLI